jgi:hypothetical protein
MDKNRWLRYAVYSLFGALFVFIAMWMMMPGWMNYGMGMYPGMAYVDRMSIDYWGIRNITGAYGMMPMTGYSPMSVMPYSSPAYITGLPMTGMQTAVPMMNAVPVTAMPMAMTMLPAGGVPMMNMPVTAAYSVWMR